MSSATDILSVINNLKNDEDSEEGQYEKMLDRLGQQCAEEKAKRTSLEIEIEKCHANLCDITFLSTINREQNKAYKDLHTVLTQNVNIQEKLVKNINSCDWEKVNSLWRFKCNVILQKNERMMQYYQDQQTNLKTKMNSISTINNLQENQRIFEETQEELLELEKKCEQQMQQVDNKLERTKKNLQNVSSALVSSEETVMSLTQNADYWEREVKHISESKLEKTNLVKNLQQEIRKFKNVQEIRRKTNYMDIFKVPSLPFLKRQSIAMRKKSGCEETGVKTLIEDRKRYSPLSTLPTASEYSPRKIEENSRKGEYSRSEIIDNKLKQDKQIKILEHIILMSPLRETVDALRDAEDAVTEQNFSSLIGQSIKITPKILKILQQGIQSSTDVEEDSKQDTGKNDGEQFLNRQIIGEDIHRSQLEKKHVSYTTNTQSNTKDDCKSDNEQENKVEPKNALKGKNIIEQESDKIAKKEQKKRANDLVAQEELKCEENEVIERGNIFVREKKSEAVPFLKLNEKENPIVKDSIEKEIKIDEEVQTSEIHLPESQELFLHKTCSNVNKRKSDNPAITKESPNAKHFKSKTDDNDLGSHMDSSPLQSLCKGDVNVGDNSGSGDEMEKMFRKAFELCGGEETSENRPQDIKIESNDDFESFCNRFKESDNNSAASENGSNHNNDDAGWSGFGNAFKFETTDGDDGGFSSKNKSFFN